MGFIPGAQGWCNICKSINVTHHINHTHGKHHRILSIRAEKAFDKIQHPFMIKTLNKIGIEGKYLNIIKVLYDKPSANIILTGEKLKAFPLKSGTRRMPTLTTLIQHSSGSPSQSKIKGIQIGNKEIKVSHFCRLHDSLYRKP